MAFFLHSLLYILFLIYRILGCENEVWFQASESTFLEHYTSDLVASVSECARKCYKSFPFCKSAVYEPLIFPTSNSKGYCKYSPWRLNCLPHLPLVTNYRDDVKSVLHCIHCLSPAPVISRFAQQQSAIVTTQSPSQSFVYTQNLQFQPEQPVPEPNVQFQSSKRSIILSIMTFNTWNSGNNVYDGLTKIARHINVYKPDIVGLQEMYDDKIDGLLQLLQNQYKKCNQKYGSNFIITRWPIYQEHYPSFKLYNAGCRIELQSNPPLSINVWNVHLHWGTYGPYAACSSDPNVLNSDVLFYSEYRKEDPSTSRVHNILNMLNHQPFTQNLNEADKSPLILVGDFNSPSHLDWTENFKRFHCDWNFVWPVSKLVENFGLKDSFREVHKDAGFVPGITWSPVVKYGDNNTLEPQDRIDFVYYAGKNLRPYQSSTYHGSNSRLFYYPNHYFNDWPSDHCSVVTNFEVDIPP